MTFDSTSTIFLSGELRIDEPAREKTRGMKGEGEVIIRCLKNN
jgi:hypothetical protein